MGLLTAGQVVTLPFPFSNLKRKKLRPVLLVADVGRSDWIVCQITSNPYADHYAIVLGDDAFASGGLQYPSFVRPNKLFTANESLILTSPGLLNPSALERIKEFIVEMILGTK